MSFSVPTDYTTRPVAVVGAGTLGRRIALVFAAQGGEVRINDLSEDSGAQAIEYVRDNLDEQVKRIGGKKGTVVYQKSLADAVDGVWLVVEAIPERLDLKKSTFQQLDSLAPSDAILGSNSSSYASSLFTEGLAHPERILNTHFYMPPTQNALDIMSDGKTDRDVLDFVLKVFPEYGVYPFEARKQSTGFIFNRVWAAIKRECLEVVYEGVTTPAELDDMFRINLGMPRDAKSGPFRMMDKVGLDVVYDIESHYHAENPNLPEGPLKFLKPYLDRGDLGVKTGKGFYDDYTS